MEKECCCQQASGFFQDILSGGLSFLAYKKLSMKNKQRKKHDRKKYIKNATNKQNQGKTVGEKE